MLASLPESRFMAFSNVEFASVRPIPPVPRLIFASRWLQLPSVLKVKLATAIIGISSIHLLKTFINAANYSDKVLIAQTAIHIMFLLSAMAIASTDRIMLSPAKSSEGRPSDH